MATLTLAPIAPGSGWGLLGTLVTWTVADGTSDYRFFSTGREVLHYKVATGPVTLTITSQGDTPAGRTGNFSQSVATGVEGMTQMFPRNGWADTSGYINIPAPDANFSFWVEIIPN